MFTPRAPLRVVPVSVIDFGGATFEHQHKSTIINTRQYRGPEVILNLGWDMASDMWSVGCILMELYLGELLFATHDSMEHLALMEACLGRFPSHMCTANTHEVRKYFNRHGGMRFPEGATQGSVSRVMKMRSLGDLVHADDTVFYDFIRQCLQLDPRRRITAADALNHRFFTAVRGYRKPVVPAPRASVRRRVTSPSPAVPPVAAQPAASASASAPAPTPTPTPASTSVRATRAGSEDGTRPAGVVQHQTPRSAGQAGSGAGNGHGSGPGAGSGSGSASGSGAGAGAGSGAGAGAGATPTKASAGHRGATGTSGASAAASASAAAAAADVNRSRASTPVSRGNGVRSSPWSCRTASRSGSRAPSLKPPSVSKSVALSRSRFRSPSPPRD